MKGFWQGFEKAAESNDKDTRPFYKKPLPTAVMFLLGGSAGGLAAHQLVKTETGALKNVAKALRVVEPVLGATGAALQIRKHIKEKGQNG